MSTDQPQGSEGVRAAQAVDHARLETLFTKVLASFEEGDWQAVREVWSRFEAGLADHLAAEELVLLPRFTQADPAESAVLLQDHAGFRATLEALGVGLALHEVNQDVARDFIDRLRAHARREDEVLYRWAERERERSPGACEV